MLKRFGYCPDGDYSRARLYHERDLVKGCDPAHPLIMSMSDTWGLPWLGPWPDIFGYSIYTRLRSPNGTLENTRYAPWWFRLRAQFVKMYARRRSFIHELQMEPWGPRDIQLTTRAEQDETMSVAHIRKNFAYARQTGLAPYYLWGLEWWYWRRLQGDESVWSAIREETRTLEVGEPIRYP